MCAMYSDRQTAESVTMPDIPERRFSTVATDLFSISGKDYLVLVDTYSTFIEVDHLKSSTSEEVIHKLKSQFARNGRPEMVISDNGPQYSSAAFTQFAHDWRFQHQTSSPGDSQSNGAAEAAVKSVKRLMKKCQKNNEDPYIGLLNLRNTHTECLDTSPVQRLMQRRTNTVIPTSSDALEPSVSPDERHAMAAKNIKVAQQHLHRQTLTPLQAGEDVRLQPIRSGERMWKRCTVQKHLDGKSYEVITEDGRALRRSENISARFDSITPENTPHAPL
jgi:hypothetical protein